MFTLEDMARAAGRVVEFMPDGTHANDAKAQLEASNKALAHYGFDPAAVTQLGQAILGNAVQQNLPPEETVIGAFSTGLLMAAFLLSQARP